MKQRRVGRALAEVWRMLPRDRCTRQRVVHTMDDLCTVLWIFLTPICKWSVAEGECNTVFT